MTKTQRARIGEHGKSEGSVLAAGAHAADVGGMFARAEISVQHVYMILYHRVEGLKVYQVLRHSFRKQPKEALGLRGPRWPPR